MPFKKMPAHMIIEMVYGSVFWLNMFPGLDGISKTLSPRSIIAGLKVNYTKHCRLEFGTYVQIHKEHDNSMATRTSGAIALRPTGNDQGGYFFFSLTTGRRLNRNRWTSLPMPTDVIERIHNMARRGHAPRGILFADRAGIDDPNDDHPGDDPNEHNINDDGADFLPDGDDSIAGVYDNENNNGNQNNGNDMHATDENEMNNDNENENEIENENETNENETDNETNEAIDDANKEEELH
jgi:hypothetical protein